MPIKHLHVVTPALADEYTKKIYAQIKRDFGAIVEPMSLHSSVPRLLAGAWMATRETLITGTVPRATKEVIAASISQANECPYCVDAHTMMLDALGEHDLSGALISAANIDDPKLQSIKKWALSTLSPNSEIVQNPPFSAAEAPEIIGTAVLFHYINKLVSVFLSETPLPSNHQWLKGSLKRIAGWYFSSSAKRSKIAGESLTFLPDAALPPDLNWAAGSPNVSQALARFSAAIESGGENALSPTVRNCVQDFIESWQGEQPGISRRWVEKATRELAETSKQQGKTVLLASIAPYQILEEDIVRLKQEFLLGAIAWGSFSVAKKIGSWLYVPLQNK